MKLISVIIPIFKVEQYLKRCIDSVISQTYSNLEIILVDDGSPDGCGMICDKYAKVDKRIKVIHKKNGGLSSARNAGLKAATGQYIGFVDSDDYISPDMYAYLYNIIVESGAEIAICNELNFKTELVSDVLMQNEQIEIYNREGILKKYFRVDCSENKFFSSCTRLYQLGILDNIVFSEGMLNEDVDFSYKVFMRSNKVVVSNLCKYYYYVGNNSITRNKLSLKDYDLLKMWDIVVELTKNNTPKFLYYAKLNRIRAEFTLLCKMALYGLDENLKDDLRIKQMMINIRKEYWNLIQNKGLPVNRKFVLTIMCINFNLLRILVGIFRK